MIYIGIDPGLNGAVAILNHGYEPLIYDTPTVNIGKGKSNKMEYVESAMTDLLDPYKDNPDVLVGIEKQQVMPSFAGKGKKRTQSQGTVSSFKTGLGYGLWVGILAGLRIPYDKITPQSWKKEMMDGMGKEKAASCLRASQLYPGAELFGPKGGAKDGRGDALLIATHVKRKNSVL